MSDPTTWNAGDFHQWVRPVSEPCEHCECCSAALCQRAVERDSACHWEGRSGDFDLARCPCWTLGSPLRAATKAS